MKRLYSYLYRPLLCFCLFYLTACGAAGSIASQSLQRATSVPTQPVTASQLLHGAVIYVALGASDAVGVGGKPGTPGYVTLITNHLPAGSRSINLGISGIHLHAALSKELPLALSTVPRLITIWLVANDFIANVPYDSYMHDLNTLLAHLRAGTRARIVMANLPDLTRLPIFARLSVQQRTAMAANLQRWNTGIAAAAARYTVSIVDLYAHKSQLTAHPEYVSSDGFHPSSAGYAQLANYFWQAIDEPG